jgi:hypothetical protein
MADQDRFVKLIETWRDRETRLGTWMLKASRICREELEAVLASPGSETVTPELSAALRDWETAKRAFDAVRPCFSSNQLRELEAVERRLLAAIHQLASPGSVSDQGWRWQEESAAPINTFVWAYWEKYGEAHEAKKNARGKWLKPGGDGLQAPSHFCFFPASPVSPAQPKDQQ